MSNLSPQFLVSNSSFHISSFGTVIAFSGSEIDGTGTQVPE